MKPEEKDIFIGNEEKLEVHHWNCKRAACQIDEIKKPKEFYSLIDARKAGYDPCGLCFRSEH